MSLFLAYSSPSSSSPSSSYIPFSAPSSKLHFLLHKSNSLSVPLLSPKLPSLYSFTRLFCSYNYTFSGDDAAEPPFRKPKPPIRSISDKETSQNNPESDSDPPNGEDEWGGVGVGGAEKYEVLSGDGTAGVDVGHRDDKLWELKRALVDTVYGTNFGFGASNEVRGEVLELVAQLEAANPTPAPVEAPEILDGNWVLLYTAFSELLPLLAAGTTPLLKVEKINQSVNSSNLTIENSATFSSPFATFSFSASASFEVRSSSRIQVEFKEGMLKPPEIKSRIDLPENLDIFGQKVNLSSVRQSLNPLQDAVAGIASTISGQPPLRIPIPGERTKSWLLITYLDKDLRISRGDGGLFVLAKEGSPLLDQ